MLSEQATNDVAESREYTAGPRIAIVKMLILLGLSVWAFLPELRYIVQIAVSDSDWAHGLAAPLAILLLVLLRRKELGAALTGGSAWGILLLLLGIGLYAALTWPFCYTYPRQAAMVIVAAGLILAVCGWGVLKLCTPMLLMLFLSIPVSPRAYAALIIRPETMTLSVTRLALDQLPDVDVTLDGPDLSFTRADQSGVVALGEPRRGASLLTAYLAIGVFVVFARIRPFWKVALMAAAAAPIALLCNLFRIVCWGLITIYAGVDPVSPVPRAGVATMSLLLAYAIFSFGCWLSSCIVLELYEDDSDDSELVETAEE